MRHSITLRTLSLLSSLAAVYADTLGIEVTKAVECTRKTENGDTIMVNYKGTLESDGTKFDSSYDRNQPFEFTLGSHQVIAGWDQGLLGMCIGEGRKLTIPPHLAYGNSQVGKIPAGSTLIFETELMGIEGVDAEPVVPARPTPGRPLDEPKPSVSPAETPIANPEPSSSEEKPATSAAAEAKPTSTSAGQASPMSEKKGECNLLGDFALIVQGALGLLAVSSLVYKRYRESPRRPIKIWFFDVSKQVFGSVLLHLANILMSMLSSGKFDVDASTKATPQNAGTDDGDEPNPCSFYLLNLAIDTTIGIPILVILLKLLHRAFLLTPMANPPESIRSGNYGHPPRVTWWLKQSVIYFLGLIGMKLCVLAIFELLPWIAWVGDWALRWTEGNTAIQITFVMFIFPLIMNALQYWIIDGFIKDPAGGENHYVGVDSDESDSEDDDDHEWLERQRRRLHGEESDLEEANPTPVPVRKSEVEYDPSTDGTQGNSRDGGKERRD